MSDDAKEPAPAPTTGERARALLARKVSVETWALLALAFLGYALGLYMGARAC